jgi:hypothetical protein
MGRKVFGCLAVLLCLATGQLLVAQSSTSFQIVSASVSESNGTLTVTVTLSDNGFVFFDYGPTPALGYRAWSFLLKKSHDLSVRYASQFKVTNGEVYYRVSALNGLGASATGTVQAITVGSGQPAQPPQFTTIGESGITSTSFTVSVTADKAVTAVLDYTLDGAKTQLRSQTPQQSHTFSVAGLSASATARTVQYTVTITDSGGLVTTSGQRSFQLPAKEPTLTFTSVQATPNQSTSLSVTVSTSIAATCDVVAKASGVTDATLLHDTAYTASRSVTLPIPGAFQTLSAFTVLVTAKSQGGQQITSNPITVTLPQAPSTSGSLITSLTVKEVAGTGATQYPVRFVVPLPAGQYQDTSGFVVVDSQNRALPTQAAALTRNWNSDNSVRFAVVDVLASVDRFAGTGTGTGKAALKLLKSDSSSSAAKFVPAGITESANVFEISNRQIKLVIQKNQFRLISQAYYDSNGNGAFEPSELILDNSSGGARFEAMSGTVYDSGLRQDVRFTVEEAGPVRVVLKAEAPTLYTDMNHYQPGFAVRIYVYAENPFVKIDYQLQAGALDAKYAGPLYFNELSLDFATRIAPATARVTVGLQGAPQYSAALGTGLDLRQVMHNQAQLLGIGGTTPLASGTAASGYMDVTGAAGGVTAFVRNFWQMWPNGIQALPDGSGTRLRLQLFPEWGTQLYSNNQLFSGGFYWLDDMQSVYKEAFLLFHPSSTDMTGPESFAATAQHYPVAALPYQWYQGSKGLASFGDLLPSRSSSLLTDYRLPDYSKAATASLTSTNYPYGWINYGDLEPGYRDGACATGGFAYSNLKFLLSEDPRDFFRADAAAMAELNTRPEYLSGYLYASNFSLLNLTENPYCGTSWRAFEGNSVPNTAFPYLSGTKRLKSPRDDEHSWFYHMEEAYYITGNPWIKDWYEFVAEYRKTRLNQKDPWPDWSGRALGHSLGHALQAYRVTGDRSILTGVQAYLDRYLRPVQDPAYGDQTSARESTGGNFGTGYLARTIEDYLDEVNGIDKQGYARAFAYLTGLVEWNYNYGRYPYFYNVRTATAPSHSNGTSSTWLDPMAWYAVRFGRKKYLDDALLYATSGVNGGEKPIGNFNTYSGDFVGRAFITAKENPTLTDNAMVPVSGIHGTASGGSFQVAWPQTSGATQYFVFYSHSPISATPTTDPAKKNWWACDAVAVDAPAGLASEATVKITTGVVQPLNVVVFAVGADGKISEPSAITSVK